jgi:hypothetical protein
MRMYFREEEQRRQRSIEARYDFGKKKKRKIDDIGKWEVDQKEKRERRVKIKIKLSNTVTLLLPMGLVMLYELKKKHKTFH